MALDIELQLATSNYTVPMNDTVRDDILVSYGSVILRVLDHATNTMDVSSDDGETLWSRTDGASQKSVTIPATESATTQIDMLIMAKDVTGAEVGRRTQIVIIKHRPTT